MAASGASRVGKKQQDKQGDFHFPRVPQEMGLCGRSSVPVLGVLTSCQKVSCRGGCLLLSQFYPPSPSIMDSYSETHKCCERNSGIGFQHVFSVCVCVCVCASLNTV